MRDVRIADVLAEVAETNGLSVSDLTGRSRDPRIVWPRHIAMYLAYAMTSRSYTEIGIRFDRRDHSTVLAAANKIRAERDEEAGVAAALDALWGRIRARCCAEAVDA